MIDPKLTRCMAPLLCCGGLPRERIPAAHEFVMCCSGARIGRHLLLCGRRESFFPFQCMVGPDWLLVLGVIALIIGINIPVIYLQFVYLNFWVGVVGCLGFAVLLSAYLATACSNPGVIFKDDFEPLVEEGGVANNANANSSSETDASTSDNGIIPSVPPPTTMACSMCELRRPVTARHCTYCEKCIDGLDHHCPWSGQCIGRRNMKYFVVFVSTLTFQWWFLLGSFITAMVYIATDP